MAGGLQLLSQWGRRAEDPFRGLRAGPVRYSPLFHFRRSVTRKSIRTLTGLPQGTPNISISGGSVCVQADERRCKPEFLCLNPEKIGTCRRRKAAVAGLAGPVVGKGQGE